MGNPIVFMFSGQGSHYYQMGREMFDTNEVFRHWMRRGDEIASAITGASVVAELYLNGRKKNEWFDDISVTHPAIFLVEYALAQVLLGLGYKPAFLLGASLGELAACCVAGCVSFEQSLQLVARQAQYLRSHHAEGGGMLAILAPPSLYESLPLMRDTTTLCSVNFDKAFVVAGSAASLDRVQTALGAQSVAFQRLAVRQAFHSAAIDGMKPFYLGLAQSLPSAPARIPILSCARAGIISGVGPEYLWDVIRTPIRFQETIQKQEQLGPFNYIDLGPSGTLATFVKYNLAPASQSKFFATMTPFGQETRNLEKLARECPPN